jgi:hypothetical protein
MLAISNRWLETAVWIWLQFNRFRRMRMAECLWRFDLAICSSKKLAALRIWGQITNRKWGHGTGANSFALRKQYMANEFALTKHSKSGSYF